MFFFSSASSSPKGPGLIAIKGWNDDKTMKPRGTELEYTKLIHYETNSYNNKEKGELEGYIENDMWMGGAWIENNGKSAVIFTGAKAYGEYFYGYHDGSIHGYHSSNVPQTHTRVASGYGGKGGKARSYKSMILFYDTEELAKSARGEILPSELQPYAVLNFDEYLINANKNNTICRMAGYITYDRARGILYVLEGYVNATEDVVHVFKLK